MHGETGKTFFKLLSHTNPFEPSSFVPCSVCGVAIASKDALAAQKRQNRGLSWSASHACPLSERKVQVSRQHAALTASSGSAFLPGSGLFSPHTAPGPQDAFESRVMGGSPSCTHIHQSCPRGCFQSACSDHSKFCDFSEIRRACDSRPRFSQQ